MAEDLPEDIADMLLDLLAHAEPEIRAEALFAIGLHWRLARAVGPIADLVDHDDDWHVRIRAISALGAIGRAHQDAYCQVARVLATAVLNERLADNERMIAYTELQHVAGRITFKEALTIDESLPDELAGLELDRPWVEELAGRECPER